MNAYHLKQAIQDLLAAHLSADQQAAFWASYDASAKFELGAGFMPLCLQKLGTDVICVYHYYIQEGDLIDDPRIDLFMHQPDGKTDYWTPLSITQPPISILGRVIGGYREVARLGEVEGRYRITHYAPAALRDVASFANTWGRNIRAQGWITHATMTSLHLDNRTTTDDSWFIIVDLEDVEEGEAED